MKNNIKNILENITDLSKQLHQCLIKEHDVLNANKIDELIAVSEQKQVLVTQLENMDKQRIALSDNKNFELFLKSIDEELIIYWENAKQSIKKCKKQNEINGMILQRQNIITREALEIFTGRKPTSDTTYGPDGLTNHSNSLVTSVKA